MLDRLNSIQVPRASPSLGLWGGATDEAEAEVCDGHCSEAARFRRRSAKAGPVGVMVFGFTDQSALSWAFQSSAANENARKHCFAGAARVCFSAAGSVADALGPLAQNVESLWVCAAWLA